MNDLTWQEWRSSACPMESSATLTNHDDQDRPAPDSDRGTESNLSAAQLRRSKFDHASTLPRKASLADMDTCQMYFVAGSGLIKIGISTNVQSRFRAIRNSSPVPVELVAVIRGNTFSEGMAHAKFAHLRRHGEWFEDCEEIREFIAWRLGNPKFNIESDYSWAEAVEREKARA